MSAKILIVEDNWGLNRLFRKVLVSAGYTCEAAHSLAEVQRTLDGDEKPDLIVLDIRLLDGSGIDVLNLLAEKGLQKTPVVVISAYAYAGKYEPAEGYAMTEYVLMKPVGPRDLVEKVTRLLAPPTV